MKPMASWRPWSVITSLALASATVAAAPPAGGRGPYRLGMTPAEVQAVKECAPYRPVKSTGGLECPAFAVAGRKRNVSFVFDAAAGLKKIQVWFYEGQDAAAAEAALVELIAWMGKEHGELESNSLRAGEAVTAKALFAALGAQPGGGPRKAQLKPKRSPADAFVFASVFHDPTHGWFVFSYVQPPR